MSLSPEDSDLGRCSKMNISCSGKRLMMKEKEPGVNPAPYSITINDAVILLPADVLQQFISQVLGRSDFVRQVAVDCRLHQLIGERGCIVV